MAAVLCLTSRCVVVTDVSEQHIAFIFGSISSYCPSGQAVRAVLRVKQSVLSFGSSSPYCPSSQAFRTVLRVKQSVLSFGSSSPYCPSSQAVRTRLPISQSVVFSDYLLPMMQALRSFKRSVAVFQLTQSNISEERLRWSRGNLLAFGTQGREFKPGRSRRIFRAKKSSARLPSEGK